MEKNYVSAAYARKCGGKCRSKKKLIFVLTGSLPRSQFLCVDEHDVFFFLFVFVVRITCSGLGRLEIHNGSG